MMCNGNIQEWVGDCWHSDYRGAPSDGSAWTRGGDCDKKGLRGDSWTSHGWFVNSVNREWGFDRDDLFDGRTDDRGFRVARTLNP